ncbi:MAG: beta-galactosidase [Armatimonadetes bacterium]|nr:beta-galactosidase [Armatimonadota bacterium]
MNQVRGGTEGLRWSRVLGIPLSMSMPLLALVTVQRSGAAEPSPKITAKFADIPSRVGRTRQFIADKPAPGKDSYVRLGLAVVERFPGPVPGGPAGKELEWASLQSEEVTQVLDWTEQRINALQNGAPPVIVPRPAGGRIVIRNGLLFVPTLIGDSKKVTRRPYWLSGYMNYAASAFNTTTDMLPEWRNLGVTLLQNAPSLAFVGPDWTPLQKLKDLPKVLQTAADNGVMMDLAVAPHIMPDWAIKDAPDVMSTTPAGFINYNIDHPKAREVIERWLRMYVPVVKDSPALFGFYLSNEPEYLHSGRDQYSRPLWIEWLKRHHPTIRALNALYKTDYQSFDGVPVPAVGMPDGLETRRAYYDWVTFNHQHFADWHGWMNGIIKSIAPRALTHVKALRVLDVTGDQSFVPVPDPELFSDFTDLADSDAWPCVPAHEGPEAYWWRSQALNYDLLHSFRGQPVFDSENHPIPVPFGPQSIPPAQTYAAVWQGALHHRAATAIFVWECWTTGDSQGQIYFRPANIYAADRAMLDMNRLSEELAAINVAKPKVALLYSRPSVFWEQSDYPQALRSVYTALTFMGQPVTFVSERQLATGKFSKANDRVDWILLPRATHVRESAMAGLEKFVRRGGHVVMVGRDCLGWDEYHRPRPLPKSLLTAKRIGADLDERGMMGALKPVLISGGLETVKLTEALGERDAWGVEYRVVRCRRDLHVPMISYNEQAETVRLHLSGRAVDLLSGKDVDLSRIALAPMEPRLLRIRRK